MTEVAGRSWYDMTAAERQGIAVSAAGWVLSTIAAERREPDDWERFFLGDAILAIKAGLYDLAMECTKAALDPVSNRSMEGADRYRDELKARTLGALTLELRMVRGVFAKDFGGPIFA
jgi:hypothetical protein